MKDRKVKTLDTAMAVTSESNSDDYALWFSLSLQGCAHGFLIEGDFWSMLLCCYFWLTHLYELMGVCWNIKHHPSSCLSFVPISFVPWIWDLNFLPFLVVIVLFTISKVAIEEYISLCDCQGQPLTQICNRDTMSSQYLLPIILTKTIL
jgi:hypothetical protein